MQTAEFDYEHLHFSWFWYVFWLAVNIFWHYDQIWIIHTVSFILFILWKVTTLTPTGALDHQLRILRSESFNHYGNYIPSRAHDGRYDTWYSIKDGEVAGNFLKLYLSQAYSIGEVKMISRSGRNIARRIVNTEVRVYSTVSEESELTNCGKVTGKHHRFKATGGGARPRFWGKKFPGPF